MEDLGLGFKVLRASGFRFRIAGFGVFSGLGLGVVGLRIKSIGLEAAI